MQILSKIFQIYLFYTVGKFFIFNTFLSIYFLFHPGLRDLKVFMELATISAGENDADIDRLASFETAVMGYGPLIYSLSENAGFEKFMDHAKQVWDTLDKDEKLLDKLVSFCKHLIHKYESYDRLLDKLNE